jgi:hypothetical protein
MSNKKRIMKNKVRIIKDKMKIKKNKTLKIINLNQLMMYAIK